MIAKGNFTEVESVKSLLAGVAVEDARIRVDSAGVAALARDASTFQVVSFRADNFHPQSFGK
jgi:hypothetical protein